MENNKNYRTPAGDLLEVILTEQARKANLIDVISIESCEYKYGKMNYIDELSEQLEQYRFNLTNKYICLYALQGTPTSYNIPPELDKRINEIKNAIEVVRNSFDTPATTQPQQKETKIEQETIKTKPELKPEAVPIVFDILKDYFDKDEQTELKQIIETGNKANKKLLFKDNGNRLTDTFKKLFENHFIIRCQKIDLIDWVVLSFKYVYRGKVKEYKRDTVRKIISQNIQYCKNPLIEIKNGKIQKVEQPRIKKYNNY